MSPTFILPLAATALVYAWGVWNVWRRAGLGHGITVQRCLCFAGAVGALLVALASPLDALSAALLSAHMTQHLILIFAVAPLLVLCDLPYAMLWALPRRWARAISYRLNHTPELSRAWQVISNPACAWLMFTAALWGWHSMALYESALRDEATHALEHLSFLFTAMLFWRVLVQRDGPNVRRYALAVPYLFTTALQSGAVGALMTFSSEPWYPYYVARTAVWGFTSLQDQQVAGLIMWMPGGAVYSLLAIRYFAAWFRTLEQRAHRVQSGELLNTHQGLR